MTHARIWVFLLSLFLLLAPLEGFAARAKAPKAKARTVAVVKKKQAAKQRVAARKQVVARKRAKAQPQLARAAVDTDPRKLVLKSSVAYVVDQDTGEVLLGKNDEQVRPIASLTKLMAGMVVAEAKLPLDEHITITSEDVDRLKGSSSRLPVGTVLTRRQALHLALMSSENRATHALARTYPGGESAFVSAMNNIAQQLGMDQTRYVEPTGLSPQNRSSARDLATLADAAYDRPLLRKYSTSPGYRLDLGEDTLRYVNSNRLVRAGSWPIGLQKTGYISEAGQCLLVQTRVDGRNLIMVFLDSASKASRIADAERVKRWILSLPDTV